MNTQTEMPLFAQLFAPLKRAWRSVGPLNETSPRHQIPFGAPGSTSKADAVVPPPSELSRLDRKLNVLRKRGLFGDDTQGAHIEQAKTAADLLGAYQLVHDIYVETGFITPDPSGVRLRIFEARPDTATFVAKVDDRVVGVLSIVADSPEMGLPSDSAFKPELDELRSRKLRLCEATNQVVHADFRKSAVATELMRCAVAYMTEAGFDEVIATVSPSHNGFYELLRFRQVGDERSYSTKLHDPVIALCMDVNQYRKPMEAPDEAWQFVHHFMAAGNHFLGKTVQWAAEAKADFLSVSLLRQLFVTATGFADQFSQADRKHLKKLWGNRLFKVVCGRSLPWGIQEKITATLCWLDTFEFSWGLPTTRKMTAH